MNPKSFQLIGLMSGTSGDGLDLAYCEYKKSDNWTFEILEALTIPFPENLGHQLSKSHLLTANELAVLDVAFGNWMGEQVAAFCKEREITPFALCSHGHTVFHQPNLGLSLQIGNGWALHQASGLTVVNDFRMLDIQLGGQGAPLVPIGDELLFPQMDFCINLGGISNISMKQNERRVAFDMSPFNILLNPIAQILGAPYDQGGQWASEGKVSNTLLDKLNNLPFYSKKGAKSLGREDMEQDFEPLIKNSGLAPKDLLATLIEHYALQISQVIRDYSQVENPQVLITGGGAYNSYFIQRLDVHLEGQWNHFQASSELIEFKEALIFGFLGLLRLLGEENCLSSVTGARRNSSGGVIYS